MASQHASATFTKILDAAAHHFATHGFAGARVDRIALDAGVNKAMLYYHVGDKEALFHAVIERNFDLALTRVREAVNQARDASEKLRAFVLALTGLTEEIPDHPRIMLREFASGGAHLPPNVVDKMVAVMEVLRGILGEGERSSQFRAANSLLLHLLIVGSVVVMSAMRPFAEAFGSRMAPEGLPPTNASVAETITDILLNGIGVGEKGDLE